MIFEASRFLRSNADLALMTWVSLSVATNRLKIEAFECLRSEMRKKLVRQLIPHWGIRITAGNSSEVRFDVSPMNRRVYVYIIIIHQFIRHVRVDHLTRVRLRHLLMNWGIEEFQIPRENQSLANAVFLIPQHFGATHPPSSGKTVVFDPENTTEVSPISSKKRQNCRLSASWVQEIGTSASIWER
jgi:hypothetical protein